MGTRSGPVPPVGRAQSSNVLIVNGALYVVDAGEGVTRRHTRAGLPVERRMRTDMGVNLKTARALGVTIPESIVKPDPFYVQNGGAVFYAMSGATPIGVVAVKNLTGGVYEFCKLVVRDEARGLGVGRALVETCIAFAQQQGARLLMLQSFKRLDVALGMYERMGFVPMTAPLEMLVLARTEIVLGMPLNE